MYKDINHFYGLNALRFFAAYLVVLHHAEQIRMKYELYNLKDLSFFNNGGIAVTFFFVLSGFLISYLLLKEITQRDDVSVKKFYTRRILRIWPLYFLLVLIGTVLIPYLLKFIGHDYEMPYHFNDVILYYVFFSPFMVNILFGHHLLEPLWSIGVEEVFYILWAPLFKFLKRHILKIIIAVIALKVVLLVLLPQLGLHPIAVQLIKTLQFEAMAIGGLAAYILYHRSSDIASSILFSKPMQVLLVVFVLLRIVGLQYVTEHSIVLGYLYTTPILSQLLIMVSFAWLIINISVNKNSIVKLNYKVFEFLGDISYGIYMYHMLIVFGIILLFKNHLSQMGSLSSTVVYYVALTSIVIAISYLSKRIFENPFLEIKKKFRL